MVMLQLYNAVTNFIKTLRQYLNTVINIALFFIIVLWLQKQVSDYSFICFLFYYFVFVSSSKLPGSPVVVIAHVRASASLWFPHVRVVVFGVLR